MHSTRRVFLTSLMATTAIAALAPASFAQDVAAAEGPVVHEVLMLNKDPDDKKRTMIFLPDIVVANPGDTVRFIATDGGHNAVADKNMVPEGAELFKSKISKDFEVTLTVEGTYGYYCQPHRSMGMVGLILVGDATSNYQAAKAVPQKGKTKKVYAEMFERADALVAQ